MDNRMEGHVKQARQPVISEAALIPISMVIIIIGGVYWLTSVYAQGHANALAIIEIKNKQDKYNEIVQSIDNRLNRIEGTLGVKNGR